MWQTPMQRKMRQERKIEDQGWSDKGHEEQKGVSLLGFVALRSAVWFYHYYFAVSQRAPSSSPVLENGRGYRALKTTWLFLSFPVLGEEG